MICKGNALWGSKSVLERVTCSKRSSSTPRNKMVMLVDPTNGNNTIGYDDWSGGKLLWYWCVGILSVGHGNILISLRHEPCAATSMHPTASLASLIWTTTHLLHNGKKLAFLTKRPTELACISPNPSRAANEGRNSGRRSIMVGLRRCSVLRLGVYNNILTVPSNDYLHLNMVHRVSPPPAWMRMWRDRTMATRENRGREEGWKNFFSEEKKRKVD